MKLKNLEFVRSLKKMDGSDNEFKDDKSYKKKIKIKNH